MKEEKVSCYVLVHGASHGAWCWKKVAPLLQSYGHTVISPDLPGHGSDHTPIREVTLKAYTDRICEVIDAQEDKVILVGHSMAGIVITQTAEYRPERIRTLVYLTALMPTDGKSMLGTTEEIRDPSVRIVADDALSYVYKEELLKQLFYGDCSEEDIACAKSMLVPQPMAPVQKPVQLSDSRFGRVKRVFIECLQDSIIPPAFQKKMYTAVPCERVISMNTSHSPFFSQPDELARHLHSLA
jgi:pimeloyl-ACP methyl ester carboxylesterase